MAENPSQNDQSRHTESDQYQITLSMPWIVRNIEGPQDAINIAISEIGKRANQADTPHVHDCELNIQQVACPNCGQTTSAVLLVGDMAMVGVTLTCEVRAESQDEGEAIAKAELGRAFEKTPLISINLSDPEFRHATAPSRATSRNHCSIFGGRSKDASK